MSTLPFHTRSKSSLHLVRMRVRLGCSHDLKRLVRFGQFSQMGCEAWGEASLRWTQFSQPGTARKDPFLTIQFVIDFHLHIRRQRRALRSADVPGHLQWRACMQFPSLDFVPRRGRFVETFQKARFLSNTSIRVQSRRATIRWDVLCTWQMHPEGRPGNSAWSEPAMKPIARRFLRSIRFFLSIASSSPFFLT